MGMGIWSMHFVGMLAFTLPVPVAYDLITVVLSVVVAIIASFIALYVVGRNRLTVRQLLVGGMLLAAGISAMHYIGMAAMLIDISYDPIYFALSIAIALIASVAALWLAFYFRKGGESGEGWKKLGSGLIMGAAVVGMHYTGMMAADFHLGSKSEFTAGMVLDQKWLAYFISGGTLFTLGLSLLGIFISNRLSLKESEMHEYEKWYKSLYENNQDGIITVNLHNQIIGFNPAASKITGLTGSLLLNQSIEAIFPVIAGEERERTRDLFLKSVSGEMQIYETAIIHQGGYRVELNVINVPVKLEGQVVGNYIIARDVTEDKRTKEKIQYLAYHDELTGLPNKPHM